jgi:hypothetical protein
MKTLKVHHKSLHNIYLTIDQLLERIKLKAYHDADKWLREFRPDVYQENPSTSCWVDSLFDEKACNQQIIDQFQRFYKHTCQFLKQYLQEEHGISSSSPDEIFKSCQRVGIITQQEAKKMLALIDAMYDLCHECDDEGYHAASNELVDYSKLMYALVNRISPR